MPETDPCGRDYPCNLLAGFSAGYDKAGNRLFDRHLHAECRSHTYEYDPASRLKRYQRGALTASNDPNTPPTVSTPIGLPKAIQSFDFGLDPVGNWRDSTYSPVGESPIAESRTHNDLNQITQTYNATFTYDDNGNLTSDGTLSFTYDALNRLKKVHQDNDLIATYYYDALGRRVKSTIEDRGGGWGGISNNIKAGDTVYLYDGDRCVEERDGSNKTLRQYVWGHYVDELMQQREYDPASNTHEDLYPVTDLTHKAVALVDRCQCPVETYDTDAYGRTLVYSEPGDDGIWFTDDDLTTDSENAGRPHAPKCRHIFTGREFDAESGLHYFRARHYSPELGRFLQRDPLGYDAGDMNLYAYCGGNPVVNTDPSGEFIWFLPIAVAAVGAVAMLYEVGKGAYYGGKHGVSQVAGAAGQGALGGSKIVANTFSFGGYDWAAEKTGLWHQSSDYQGADYAWSRSFALLSREAFIAAGTAGLGMYLSSTKYGKIGINIFGKLHYGEYGLTAMGAARLAEGGIAARGIYSGSRQLFNAYDKLWSGDSSGVIDLFAGTLGIYSGWRMLTNALPTGSISIKGRHPSWSVRDWQGNVRYAHGLGQGPNGVKVMESLAEGSFAAGWKSPAVPIFFPGAAMRTTPPIFSRDCWTALAGAIRRSYLYL